MAEEEPDWEQEGTDPELKPKEKSYYDQILEAAREAEAWWEAKRSGTGPGQEVPPPDAPPPGSRPSHPKGPLEPLLSKREEELLAKHGRTHPPVTEPPAAGEEPPWRYISRRAQQSRPAPGTPGYDDMEWWENQPHYASEEEAEEAERSGLDREIRDAMKKDRRIRLMNPPKKGATYPGQQSPGGPYRSGEGGGIVPISHQRPTPETGQPGLTSGHLSAEPAFTPNPPPEVKPPTSPPPTPKTPLRGKGGEITEEGEQNLRELYRRREGLQEF